MLVCPYLSSAELLKIFSAVNLDSLEESEMQEIVMQAQGDMESRLNKRYCIPLRAKGGSELSSTPSFTQNKIKLTMKTALRNIIGQDYLRNSDLNQLGDYTSSQEAILKGHIKDLLDYENDFQLELKPYALDAVEPIQHVGIARANNKMSVDYDG
jgi:hypothetical protein